MVAGLPCIADLLHRIGLLFPEQRQSFIWELAANRSCFRLWEADGVLAGLLVAYQHEKPLFLRALHQILE